MPVKLRPFQEDTVEKMHNGCVLYGDVGGGKTYTSLAYYFSKVCGGTINTWGSMETPKDLVVITTAKVRDGMDFEVTAAQYGIHSDPDISTNNVKITVDSWNNLHKYVEVKDAFFIFDEQRVVGYGAWSRAFIKIAKSNPWILLSATPGDTWLDYIPVFIANGWYKHKTDFIDQHVIWTPRVKYPKVLRYQDVGVLVRRRNEVLVHMPFERHTKRHPVDIVCEYDKDLFEKVVKKRWHVFEKRPLRDVAELFIVMRRVVNSDTSRLAAVRSLLDQHPKLIVFYNFDYELETLRTLVPSNQLASPESIEQLAERLNSSRHDRGRRKPSTKSSESEKCPGHWTVDRGMGEAFVTCGGRLCHPQESVPTGCEPGSSTSTSIPMGESHTIGSEHTSPNFSETATSRPPLEKESTSGETVTDDTAQSVKPSTETTQEQCESSISPIMTTEFAIAEWNGHKHEPIPKTDSWVYLVQYRAGAEGWNCIETNAMCFYSQTYSYRDFFQAHGRTDRLNTPYTDLYYYYLISTSIIDKAIRAAQKVKKNFNERDLKFAA